MGIRDRINAAARGLLAGAPVTPVATPTADVVDNPNMLAAGSRGVFGNLFYSTGALLNAVTGVGTNRDPTFFNTWATARPLRRSELYGMGRNGLIIQALAKLPNTAMREGWRVDITDPDVVEKGEVSDKIAAYEKRLNIGPNSARAMTRGRQYSEAMVLLGVDDGRPMSEPVDVNSIRTIKWSAVIDVRYYQPYRLYQADNENFGKVELFNITDINGVLEDGLRYGANSLSFMTTSLDLERTTQSNSGQIIVHADRVLHFPTPDYLPLLETLQDSLGAYFEAMSGIRTAARESSTVVYKISDLLKKMWSENAGLAQQHMSLIDRAKSSMNAWVIDKDKEDVEMTSRSLGGLADLPTPFMIQLAAALDMPMTELWGVSPGGWGTGEAEMAKWHNSVRSYFYGVAAPQLHKIDGYILAAQDGCNLSFDTQREIILNDLSPPDEEIRSKLRSESLSDIRQLLKDDVITREEARPAVAALADDYFRPELDFETEESAPLAPVGVFTAATALLQASYPAGIPPESARELMLALASSYFTPENVSLVFPAIGKPAVQMSPSPSTATELDPALVTGVGPADTEDAPADEPSEVDVAWSTTPLPSDAVEASVIAEALSIPTVRVTRAHKSGLIEGWTVLSGKPRYSMREVRRVVLEGNSKMPAAQREAATEAEPTDDAAESSDEPRPLFLALRLPTAQARWVPFKERDLSPPHITLLYVPSVKPSELADVLTELSLTLADVDPFAVHLGVVDYFDVEKTDVEMNPPTTQRYRVAFASAQFGTDAQELFADLCDAADAFGCVPSRMSERYVPHVTLAYLDEGETYDGPSPSGSWDATEVDVYYGREFVQSVPLGTFWAGNDDDATETRDKVTPLPGDPDYGSESIGEADAKYAWIWRTQRDNRVRKSHAHLEGRKFKKGERDEVHGEPGEEPNCRCAKQIIPARMTKRAERASERTVRRALKRRWTQVTGAAIKRAEAAGVTDVDDAELSDEAAEKRIAEAFAKFHEAVNMGAAELREWAATEWSKAASVDREPIERNIRLLETPREDWTLATAASAMRTVSFVARMKGAEQGEPVKIDGRKGPSKRDISLKNWAFDPGK